MQAMSFTRQVSLSAGGSQKRPCRARASPSPFSCSPSAVADFTDERIGALMHDVTTDQCTRLQTYLHAAHEVDSTAEFETMKMAIVLSILLGFLLWPRR